MLRSLFTGISGLSANQQMLDVTSNNIANVDTNGYKSVAATFEDTLSQTMRGASAPYPGTSASTDTEGGLNAVQVGLGVKLAGTTTDFTQGSTETTGRGLDVMVDGDGFLVVNDSGTTSYTRAGSLSLDKSGHLVEPNGAIVQGWSTTGYTTGMSSTGAALTTTVTGSPTDITLTGLADGSGFYSSYSIGADGSINAVRSTGGTIDKIGVIALASFPNPNGLEKIGDSEYTATANSGTVTVGQPNSGSMGSLTAGVLEMSNVNLASELTNLIIAERGYQANSRTITASDEVLQTLVQIQ